MVCTRLGRQELEGEILHDVPGALWNRDIIDAARLRDVPEDLEKVYVAVDPAVSNTENSDEHTALSWSVLPETTQRVSARWASVLDDGSCRGNPEEWARLAVSLYRTWSADKIIAEKNQGAAM